MRFTSIYAGKYHARKPQDEKKVPFRERYPLSLQNEVKGAIKLSNGKSCLYEMSLLFVCLKDNEFEEKRCEEPLQAFKKCCIDYEKHKIVEKELQKLEMPTPETKNFTEKQLTHMLKKYPTI